MGVIKKAIMVVGDVNGGKEWTEEIEVGVNETAEEAGVRIINYFNATLRRGEVARKFVCINNKWDEEVKEEIAEENFGWVEDDNSDDDGDWDDWQEDEDIE